MSEEKTTKNFKDLLTPKVIVPAVIALVVVIAVVIMAFAVNTGDNIRKGVKINGQDVGNMSKEAATELLNAKVGEFDPAPVISISYEGEKKETTVGEIMLGYDIEGAVERAYSLGRNGNAVADFFKSTGMAFAGENVEIQPLLDEAFVSQMFDNFDLATKEPMTPNSYEIEDGRIKMVHGAPGYVMDREGAMADIKTALMTGDDEIIINKGFSDPGEFDADKIYAELCKAPVDAKYETVDGKGYLRSAQDGYKFDKADLKKVIEENKDNKEPFYLDVEILKAAKTEVDTSGIFVDTLANYTSRITDSNADRLTNVRLAAEKINGVVLNPGETFRYLSHVEPITVAGGYKVANVYSNGKITQDIGGGVCQVSSALYSAALNAELEIVKRYAHSLTVAYVPLGQDATVASGEIDLRFINNTNAPLKIVTVFNPSGVTVKLLGQKVNKGRTVEIENITVETMHAETIEELDETLQPGEKRVETNPKTGYVIDTYKKIYQDGQYVGREYISRSVYKVLHKKVKVGPPLPEDAPVSGEGEVPNPETTPAPTPGGTTPVPVKPTPEPEIPVPSVPTQKPELI
ncbi:MAG: VanW family protein [Clostridia bacterium]|nr:VanW family protein [Clostridia bacterium]